MVYDSAEEGGELEVAFAGAFQGINGGLRVGMRTSFARKLGVKTGLVLREKQTRFVQSVVFRDMIHLADTQLQVQHVLLLVGRRLVKARDKKDLRGPAARLCPSVMISLFRSLFGILLPVARMLDDIGFLAAFRYDPTFVIAEFLPAVDDFVVFS